MEASSGPISPSSPDERDPAPQVPTVEIVLAYVRRFSDDNQAGPNEQALTWLFGSYPNNVDLRQVLVKVVALNALYHTNVYRVTEMAEHICGLGIDKQLAEGDHAVVDRIAALPATGKRHYSFATKYSSFHQPEHFPIYDNLVERLLWAYKQHTSFRDFARDDLQNYPLYVAILRSFMARFGLGGLTLKEVDKFLWLHAGDLYPRKKPDQESA
jgi:hypothetical protein